MTTTPQSQRRNRKGAALLAVTAVLGIGTVATLASWTVTEFVSGQFKTGAVNPSGALEASSDGTNFATHATIGNALTLGWSKDTQTLAGNDSIAAAYSLRSTAGTTANIRVTIGSELLNGTGSNSMAYSVYEVDAPSSCKASITAGSAGVIGQLGTEALLGSAPGASFAVSSATAGAPGAATHLCVKVRVPDTAVQSTQSEVAFKFTAQQ